MMGNAEQFVAGERGIRLSQPALSGAGCVSPPEPLNSDVMQRTKFSLNSV